MIVWATVGCTAWIVVALVHIYMLARLPDLDAMAIAPTPLPSLSVIICACNEADRIEAALQSLLAADYPDLEIVLVDDRSSDSTGAIIDAMAARDARITPLHVTTLADGWLGKVAAMNQGVARARGRWLLFTDADVHFARDALARAVRYAEADHADHVCLFPLLHSESFVVNTLVAAVVRVVGLTQRPWRAPDPKAKETLGAGAFNLVRRAAFDRTPGFAWLKLEVADDIGLGHMLKQHGAHARVVIGTKSVRVAWYETFQELMRGLEKNSFAQMAQFQLWRGLVIAAIGALAPFSPLVALLRPEPWLKALGAAALVAHVAGAVVTRVRLGGRLLPALLAPLGEVGMAFVLARATVLGVRRGGVLWRGTLYPSAALRAGRRVRF